MNQKSDETAQKLRGGYYTPSSIARFLSEWAMRGRATRVLEPSCGDGAFLRAIAAVRERGDEAVTVDAVEYDQVEAGKAEAVASELSDGMTDYRVWRDDFFHWITNTASNERWGAVVGNPPYIRYQYFDAGQRHLAAEVCRKAGISMSKRTNAWVPFVTAAVRHLTPGGRLAMIVPAEILHVQHSHGLRLLLEREMETITIVSLREIVFEGTLQGTVLLLAVKRDTPPEVSAGPLFGAHTPGRAASIQILEIEGVQSLEATDTRILDPGVGGLSARAFEGEWMHALLKPEEYEVVDRALRSDVVVRFADVAKAPVGIVTGANGFFVVDEATVAEFDLEEIASPMLARASLINGLTYRQGDHARNAAAGRAVYFLDFPGVPKDDLPSGMRRYVERGESHGLHLRYKCRIRDPWYKVPHVWTSGIALLKRSHHYPRLVINELGAYSTDTAYRVSMKPGYEGREVDLTFSFLNTLTLLHAELLGRHYGGGVLELVPSETAALPVPLAKVRREDFHHVDKLVRNGGDLAMLVAKTDEVLLGDHVGLSERDTMLLREAHLRLRRRRLRGD